MVDARPDILNHNLETVERLHPWARPGGRYWRSISFLGAAKRMDPTMLTKSGVILGLGEAQDEIAVAMRDLRKASVDILTLGQYLRPSSHHAPVARWVTKDEFAEWKRFGEEELGFSHVESGPLVRSSYHAERQARTVQAGGVGEISEVLEADIPAPAEVRMSGDVAAAGSSRASHSGADRKPLNRERPRAVVGRRRRNPTAPSPVATRHGSLTKTFARHAEGGPVPLASAGVCWRRRRDRESPPSVIRGNGRAGAATPSGAG